LGTETARAAALEGSGLKDLAAFPLSLLILGSATLSHGEKTMDLPFTDLGRHERRFPYPDDLGPVAAFQTEERIKDGEALWIEPGTLPKDVLAGGINALLVLDGGKEGPMTLRSVERGEKLVFHVEKASPGDKPLHAVLFRQDFLDRTAVFYLGRRKIKDILFPAERPLGPGFVRVVPLQEPEVIPKHGKGSVLHVHRVPWRGGLLFDERAYGLVFLTDPGLRLYGMERWERWAGTDRREPYVVVHVIPHGKGGAGGSPSAVLVPADIAALPSWEVRQGVEDEPLELDPLSPRLSPGGKPFQLPVALHDGPADLRGTSVPFDPLPGGWGDSVPGVKRVLSARSLDPSWGKVGLAGQELVLIALGEMGTTGYAVQVQKILMTDAVEFHLLFISPGKGVPVGEAITHPGCAVRVKKEDVTGPWRFFMNGRPWDAPVLTVE
jgi:hypothetical protein